MDHSCKLHSNSSTGQKMVESGWLDIHFQASRNEYEQALLAAGMQTGWSVLDAGAGSGSYLPLMSELVGETGSITALDLAEENITAIQHLLTREKLCCPVKTMQGSVLELPFDNNCFDAIWCANTVQYFRAELLQSLIEEFRRVIKPGGLLAIKEFDDVGLHFGPFDPTLRWHLLDALKDSDQLLGAGALFTVDLPSYLITAEFGQVRFKTFVGDFQHPFTPAQREFLGSALELYASLAERADLPENELTQWRKKIGDPDSEQYILNQPDFYFREVHGLATGIAPRNNRISRQ